MLDSARKGLRGKKNRHRNALLLRRQHFLICEARTFNNNCSRSFLILVVIIVRRFRFPALMTSRLNHILPIDTIPTMRIPMPFLRTPCLILPLLMLSPMICSRTLILIYLSLCGLARLLVMATLAYMRIMHAPGLLLLQLIAHRLLLMCRWRCLCRLRRRHGAGLRWPKSAFYKHMKLVTIRINSSSSNNKLVWPVTLLLVLPQGREASIR